MANNQPHSSLFVVPSDTINIPQPGIITTGSVIGASATQLTDINPAQNFDPIVTNANGYSLNGAVVYQSYTGAFPTLITSVTGIINNTGPSIASVSSAVVSGLYNMYATNQAGKTSFTLFVGTGGAGSTLRVLTAAGDDVTLSNLPDSSFVPLQVVRVFANGTTCSEILALY